MCVAMGASLWQKQAREREAVRHEMGWSGDEREGLMAKALAPGDLEAQPGLWFGYRSQLSSPSA